MSNPKQIGITGGIGAGKSIACKVFASLGVPIYDADSRAKLVMVDDPVLKSALVEAFGNDTYLENGALNRSYLSSLVFDNEEQLNLLNSIVHPRVAYDYNQWMAQHSHQPYVLKEAALLFESGSYKMLDKIITVTAPEDLRIARVQKRDPQRSEEEIRNIIEKQLSQEEKEKRSDFILINDESSLLVPQIISLHEQLLH